MDAITRFSLKNAAAVILVAVLAFAAAQGQVPPFALALTAIVAGLATYWVISRSPLFCSAG